MSTYNDNLRSTVLTALQSQSLDQKKLESQKNAAMFTLYHAEGATITADEKLDAAKGDVDFKAKVKRQAVNNTNIANNLVASATQADQYTKQSVTNMATCASNVQIAAKSILRLASDVGSIFSIINASDSGTEMYKSAENVRNLINNTAYSAQLASDVAMEASMLTSEVSSSALLDNSKAANSLINNLLKLTSANFDAASQIAAAANTELATASATTKLAEGNLEDLAIDYCAAKVAYSSMNSHLNLNLNVAKVTQTSFDVDFNLIEKAFKADRDGLPQPKNPTVMVQDYFLIVVKDNKKATFSVSNAEELIRDADNAKRIVKIIPKAETKDKDGKKTANKVPPFTVQVFGRPDTGTIKPTYTLQDSDGDDIVYGQKYVVVLLATYTEDYKSEINDFSNFLSAPSDSFALTFTWPLVNNKSIVPKPINNNTTGNNDNGDILLSYQDDFQKMQCYVAGDDSDDDVNKTSDYTSYITFTAPKITMPTSLIDDNNIPEYRCILLPIETQLPDTLLTEETLINLLKTGAGELSKEESALSVEVEIEDHLGKEMQLGLAITELNKQKDGLINDADGKKVSGKAAEQLKAVNSKITVLTKEKNAITKLIALAKSKKENPDLEKNAKLSFYFNLDLAQQVSAGNYSLGYKMLTGNNSGTQDANKDYFVVFVGAETTDNFGNPLVNDKWYYITVLTTSGEKVSNTDVFTDSLSVVINRNKFQYLNK